MIQPHIRNLRKRNIKLLQLRKIRRRKYIQHRQIVDLRIMWQIQFSQVFREHRDEFHRFIVRIRPIHMQHLQTSKAIILKHQTNPPSRNIRAFRYLQIFHIHKIIIFSNLLKEIVPEHAIIKPDRLNWKRNVLQIADVVQQLFVVHRVLFRENQLVHFKVE